jgi:tannase
MLEGALKFSSTLQTNWPDLEVFHDHGGKVIHFHGESDPSVPSDSSVIYHDAVRQIMYPNKTFDEGYDSLHDWYRLFLIPGAAHCSLNPEQPNGPFPHNVLESVIDWVENGINPKELNATVSGGTSSEADQKICSFPLRPLWKNNHTMECVYDRKSIDTWLPKLDSIPIPVY